jgi:hypothetical protein
MRNLVWVMFKMLFIINKLRKFQSEFFSIFYFDVISSFMGFLFVEGTDSVVTTSARNFQKFFIMFRMRLLKVKRRKKQNLKNE